MPRSVKNLSQAHSTSSRRAPPPSAPSLSQRLRPRSAFLVGLGSVPTASAAEQAAGTLRRRLDGIEDSEDDDEVIQNDQVLVHVPLNAAISDVLVHSTITYHAFLTKICGIMGVAPSIAKLGWKTSDDAKGAMPQELQTSVQLERALKTLVKIKSNPRRFKPIAMMIIHLNPNAAPYERELLLLKEKLQCATHIGLGCWCYVLPGCTKLEDHQPLGIEELNLWAKEIHSGNGGDTTGIIPPKCFSWASRKPSQMSSVVPKRQSIIEQSGNSDFIDDHHEDLLTASLLRSLDIRFPKHNFQQYKGKLQARGLLYARDILHFQRQYFLDFGMEEGAIGTFLERTEHALSQHVLQVQVGSGSRQALNLKGKEPARIQRHISVISLNDSESEAAMDYDSDDISVEI